MNDVPIRDLLATAETAADAAAQLLHDAHRTLIVAGGTQDLHIRSKTSVMDPVTDVDAAAQQCIISLIQERFPTHRFLAEEEGADALGDPASPYRWIIDPLDGTNNFIRGKENFGTIVAVAKGEELLAGCMVMPIVEHRFTAAKGLGAFVDGRPVRLRSTRHMQDAILASNLTRRAKPDAQGVLQTSLPVCVSLENYGCAAQELGEILLGWNDGAFFRGIRLWDVAAGCLMLQEAGGKYRYEWMEPENPRGGILCVASTAPIFDELCDFVFEKRLA